MVFFSKSEGTTYHQGYFNRLEVTEAFDFAWFDLLGNLTYDDVYWLRDSFRFEPSSDLFFTFSGKGRSATNSLFNIMRRSLRDSQLVKALGLSSWLENATKKLVRVNPTSRSPSMDHTILTHWLMFQYVFNWYDFDIQCLVYNDINMKTGSAGSEMLLYHLNNFYGVDSEFTYSANVDKLLDIAGEWQSASDDEEIAQAVELPVSIIRRWREVNKLPAKGLVPEYRMTESFMALLQAPDETPPSPKRALSSLKNQLVLFNPRVVSDSNVAIKNIATGVSVTTPRGQYVIGVGELSFDLGPKKRKFVLDPLFLHPHNIEALHAIFRILFINDEYLHPQLCRFVDPSCFVLSQPQQNAIQAWSYSLATNERMGAIVLPTGLGKTVVASRIADVWADCSPTRNNSCRVLFLAHQREILDQTARTFFAQTSYQLKDIGLVYQSLSKELRAHQSTKTLEEHLDARVVFGSIQLLANVFESLPANHFSLIIVDEFHHYKAPEWIPVIHHFNQMQYLLGLSATPFRGDIQDPMEIFEKNCLYRMDLSKAIWNGYLVMPSWQIFDDKTDYRAAMRQTGLSKAVIKKTYSSERVRAILEIYHQEANNKQTIAFCNSKAHAQQIAEAFADPESVEARVPPAVSAYLTSDSPLEERRQIINAFQKKEIQIICVVGLFDEGVDIPNVETLLILRKTSSPVKIFQQLGRGLRLAPGKTDVQVLDFVSNYSDRDSIFNLGLLTGINTNKISKTVDAASRLMDSSEDFPVIPPLNIKFGKGVKFLIRNITDRELAELDRVNHQQAVFLRQKHNLFANQIAQKLKTTTGKVMKWLERIPVKADEQALVHSIKQLLDDELSKDEIHSALHSFVGNYDFDSLYQKARGSRWGGRRKMHRNPDAEDGLQQLTHKIQSLLEAEFERRNWPDLLREYELYGNWWQAYPGKMATLMAGWGVQLDFRKKSGRAKYDRFYFIGYRESNRRVSKEFYSLEEAVDWYIGYLESIWDKRRPS